MGDAAALAVRPPNFMEVAHEKTIDYDAPGPCSGHGAIANGCLWRIHTGGGPRRDRHLQRWDRTLYLMINGRVRTLIYTYYNYVNAKGETREIPAYASTPILPACRRR